MKYLKKIEKFLSGTAKTAPVTGGFTPDTLLLPGLKLLIEGNDTLCVTLPDARSADNFCQEIAAFLELLQIEKKVLLIPECGRGKLLFPGGEARRARALNRILNEKFDLIIGSVHAWLGPAPLPQESESGQLELRCGMTIPVQEIVERLVKLDYDDEALVSVPGEFSRRGGILDIFSPAHDEPCRIEFFDDEIESIRFFSPETQRSLRPAECCCIINRAGITAGGAAESDAFAYLERSGDFVLVDILPENGMDILKKYSVPGAPERWESIAASHRHFAFCETMPGVPDLPVSPPFATDAGTMPEAVQSARSVFHFPFSVFHFLYIFCKA